MRRRILAATLLASIAQAACVGDGTIVATDSGTDGGITVDAAIGDSGTPASDAAACGAINIACCAGDQCGGGATCTVGRCVCGGQLSACSGSCVNTDSDARNCGACGHDCLGGACTTGVCQPTLLASGQGYTVKLVPTATKLYWSRGKTNTVSSGILSANLDGTNVTPLYIPSLTSYCNGLAVTATDAYFYCTGQLSRCSLPSCSMTPTPLLAVSGVGDVALDTVNSRLYFTTNTPYNQQTGGFIASIPAAGGAYSRLTASDQPAPSNIAIDSGFVVWLNSGTYLNDNWQYNGGVRKAPFGVNQTVTTVAADSSGGDYYGLAIEGSTAYWGNGNTQVHSAPMSGGSPTTYITTVSKTPVRGLVADKNYVYWAEDQGSIYRCEKNCVNPTKLVGAGTSVMALAQDDVSIYWATTAGDIRRLAK